MNILIVEDDCKISEMIAIVLKIGWKDATMIFAGTGEEALNEIENKLPDIIILDLWLPDMEGFEILKRVRLFSGIPIVILTANGDETSIVKGLELEADEYIVKPFKPLELIARIKKTLKGKHYECENPELDYGWLKISLTSHKVIMKEREIHLTNTELIILHHLAVCMGKEVTNQEMAEHIWGSSCIDDSKAISVYIRRLRQKIVTDDHQSIITCRGGYMLAKP